MLIAYLSDRFQHRFAFILSGLCLGISGNLILFNVHDNRRVEYAGLVIYTMGVISVCPIVICWFSLNLKGHRNRAVGTAWQIGFGNLAGIVAIFAFPSADAPRYHLGYSLGLSFLCVGGAAATAYFVGCFMENKQPSKNIRLILWCFPLGQLSKLYMLLKRSIRWRMQNFPQVLSINSARSQRYYPHERIDCYHLWY